MGQILVRQKPWTGNSTPLNQLELVFFNYHSGDRLVRK